MAKKRPQWSDLLAGLNQSLDAKVSIKAARAISKMAGPEHVGDLYALLQSNNFFVRESAAEPLARLEGVNALSFLFSALQKGESDGHDNDGLTHTLIGLIESNKKKVTPLLLDMLKSPEHNVRADAVWALGFVTSQLSPSVFFEVIRTEADAEVRSMAADALTSYVDTRKKYPVDAESFRGRWMWLDTTEHLKYGFEIEGGPHGICIKANASTYAVRDVMLTIQLASDSVFAGKQIFTNGAWYPVTGILKDQKLHMQGAGQNWIMERVD